MTDQLTSVRLSEQTLKQLRIFSEARGTSVASEIRAALDAYVNATLTNPDQLKELQGQLDRRKAEREESISAYLAQVT